MTILRALETAPLGLTSVPGASGLNHTVINAGIDSMRRRLIIISPEEDARTAAMMQADVQSAFQSIQVIIIHPIERKSLNDHPVNNGSCVKTADTITDAHRRLGLCALNVSDFNPPDLRLLYNSEELGSIRDMLIRNHVFQYFFPAPDHLALGLIEMWNFKSIQQLIDRIVRAPDLGHPFGPMEIVHTRGSFTDMIREIERRGLIVIEEGGISITPEGRALRSVVRDSSRDGLVFKILNRLSASLNFKSLWLPVLRRQQYEGNES